MSCRLNTEKDRREEMKIQSDSSAIISRCSAFDSMKIHKGHSERVQLIMC